MNKLSLLFLSIIVTIPSTAFSQWGGRPPQSPSTRYQQIIKMFDKDKDGKLSSKEREEARRSMFHQSLRGWYNRNGGRKPVADCRCACECCRPKSRHDRSRSHGPSRGRDRSHSRFRQGR